MRQLINSRKQFLLKNISGMKNDIKSEEQLIALEEEAIQLIISGVDIENINTNICAKALFASQIKTKEIVKKIDGNEEKKELKEMGNKTAITTDSYLELREKISDKDFFNSIKERLDNIPVSNGSRYYSRVKTKIGIIADEFLMNSYKNSADFVYITYENYKENLEVLDVLLVVSAWKGLNQEWKGMGNPNSLRRSKLYDLINAFKNTKTKVVFYSKEDPVNYDRFIGIAQKADYIFTTCKEVISDYIRDCNNENVDVLTFSVNPVYHNPVGFRKYEKFDNVIFSGSWYNKYPHRIKDMKMIFDGVVSSSKGLKIIDRNYELNLEQHFFPQEYLRYVSPSVNHEYLQKLHKLFNWAINFNSIKDSYTMFANRIYELQALGNCLISNYSVGVNNLFPNVFTATDRNEVKNILDTMDDEAVYKHQVNGIRRVMSTETSNDRIVEMLQKIDMDVKKTERNVLVICNKITNNIKNTFNNQSFYNKTLMEASKVKAYHIKQYDVIAYFDANFEYGRFYLEDMINAFKYTDSDYITKDAYYEGENLKLGIEHDYVNTYTDKNRTVFWTKAFNVNKFLSMPKSMKSGNGYSIDHFEFNTIKNQEIQDDKKYKFTVIIPTYNNGNHLWFKCINSLRRSSMFGDMEVIIVDDGSTDDNTISIVQYITSQFNNIRSFMFNDGGSGSASRPRNKGVELSTTEYITFLDPDNEAVNDGYVKLYNELIDSDIDLIIGNMLKLDNTKEVMLNYYKTMTLYNNKSNILIDNKSKYLIETKFKGMSIQALMVRKNIVVNNNLSQVIGAVGQDTLFFYELLLHSGKVKSINETIHIYYAAVEGSTVNNISKKYFEKALKIEKAKYKFFKENDILKYYLENRYLYYFKNWYMKKLEKVSSDEETECRNMVKELYRIYENDILKEDKEIIEFINS